MLYSHRKLNELNHELRDSSAETIIRWTLEHDTACLATTNFGPYEAVLLHHVSRIAPSTPVICIDHGYNTEETYLVGKELTKKLKLNMHYYTPKVTRSRRETIYNGVPSLENADAHKAFVEEVKLEPFARAFNEHKPDLWLTSLRKDQTEFRTSLNILIEDHKFNCLKVSPFFHWTELDMEEYLVENDLPIVENYYDPTKVEKHRECGLHLE